MADRRNEISSRFSLDKLFKFGTDSVINVRSKGAFAPPPPPTSDEMITEDNILMLTEAGSLHMITE